MWACGAGGPGGKEIYVHRDGWHRNGEWSVLSSVVSLKNQEYRGKGRLEERERERALRLSTRGESSHLLV